MLKKLLRKAYLNSPVDIRIRRKDSMIPKSRHEYQKEFIDFDIHPGANVLDIGSGGDPFPQASVLVDRFLEPSVHRTARFVKADKPVVIADIHQLPFPDSTFDFVYCSHVLEHVDDPILACREIMRVGNKGYIETPTFAKDSLMAWAKDMHKWYLVAINNNLCFFEYSERQVQGIRSRAFRDLVINEWSHPLREAFFKNQDIFNIVFNWTDHFSVFVFYLDGSMRQYHKESFE